MRYAVILMLIGVAASAATAGNNVGGEEFAQVDTGLIARITYHIFTDNYDSALILCDRVVKSRPDDPSGYFFRAYTLMTRMTEEHDNLSAEEFFGALDTVDLLARRTADTGRAESRAWSYWYLGNAWAYRSLWEARFGSGATAYKLASRARENYEISLSLDSSLYDNYAGLGAVHYWKSARGGVLRTFGIIRDEREKGIAELQLAIDSSLLSRETVRKTLVTILNDFGRYDESIAYADTLLRCYPNGRSFLWGIARSLYDKGDFNRAYTYLERLRNVLADQPGNRFKLIACDAQIVRCLERLGRKDQARARAAAAVVYLDEVQPAVRDAQSDDVKLLRKMAKKR